MWGDGVRANQGEGHENPDLHRQLSDSFCIQTVYLVWPTAHEKSALAAQNIHWHRETWWTGTCPAISTTGSGWSVSLIMSRSSQMHPWKPLKHPWCGRGISASHLNRKHVMVRSDKTILMTYLYRQGGIRSPAGCWCPFWLTACQILTSLKARPQASSAWPLDCYCFLAAAGFALVLVRDQYISSLSAFTLIFSNSKAH